MEDDDLLEMVNAGLLPWAVVDDYKARGWADVFDRLVLRTDIVFREGARPDHSRRSAAGATGIMQMLPSTAADPNVGIPDMTDLNNNIHAGVKYLDFIRGRYFNDPDIDPFNRTLFAIASYNAGPGACVNCVGRRQNMAAIRMSGSTTWR